ncbi:hypothetical protein C8R42DRAFT_652960 [Lentinula raphanica]|nr:hypothetical protein C8R42DRAFT_652960 [Lentinula raphanica]
MISVICFPAKINLFSTRTVFSFASVSSDASCGRTLQYRVMRQIFQIAEADVLVAFTVADLRCFRLDQMVVFEDVWSLVLLLHHSQTMRKSELLRAGCILHLLNQRRA